MIRFQSVTKRFGDGTIALDKVEFSIESGEMVVLTGPSGSGKTTIMRLLIKEYEPTEGEICYDNVPLDSIKKNKIPHHRRTIGVVFQDYKLIPELNVWENIALPLWIAGQKQAEIDSRITDLLTLVGITEKAHLFPTQLSGGEAQRVSIARALATGPNLIFADEPTGNLDKETSLAITRLLAKINEYGTTIILATHDPAVIAELKHKRVLNLSHGVLLSDSDPTSKKPRTVKNAVAPKQTEEQEKQPDSKHEKKSDKPVETEDLIKETVEELDDPTEKPKKPHAEQKAKSEKKHEGT